MEQGLGKYCDPDFVRYTSREMQEALGMTSEEMDMAAHQLVQQERTTTSTNSGSPFADGDGAAVPSGNSVPQRTATVAANLPISSSTTAANNNVIPNL